MRKNEYNNIKEFLSEYTGKRDPANNLWYGLEFRYHNSFYRLDYISDNILLCKLKFENSTGYPTSSGYDIIGEFHSMKDLLDCLVDGNKPFKEIIVDEATELLGKD